MTEQLGEITVIDVSPDDIYRKIYPKMWHAGSSFRKLSPLNPSGQALWIYLLCGDVTGSLPGVLTVGEKALAENLQWDLEAFRHAFGEVFREGLVKADWNARLVFIPNAIAHNKPASPNVLRSWGKSFNRLPNCDLKRLIYHTFEKYAKAFGEAFAKAFGEVFREGMPKPVSSEQGAVNSEQEEILLKDPPRNAQAHEKNLLIKNARKEMWENDARAIIEMWNENITDPLAAVVETEGRIGAIVSAIEYGTYKCTPPVNLFSVWPQIVENVKSSDFLMGREDPNKDWYASFDWLLSTNNTKKNHAPRWLHVLEGAYKSGVRKAHRKSTHGNPTSRSKGMHEDEQVRQLKKETAEAAKRGEELRKLEFDAYQRSGLSYEEWDALTFEQKQKYQDALS